MVKISFIVPENLRGKEFKLIRIHTEEGITTTSTLEYTYDSESFVLSFETDQFSIFGLVSASAKLPNTGESHTTEAFIILMSLVGLLLTLKRKLN
jgi:LPXTG-motif cell wall-anchored protein